MSETTSKPPFVLNDRTYDKLKWLVLIVLPASGTLYFALAQIWGWPHAEHVLGTVIALQAFMGGILGISSQQYKNSDYRFDGTMTTTDAPNKKIVSVETNFHPDDLAQKDQVLLKVKPASQ